VLAYRPRPAVPLGPCHDSRREAYPAAVLSAYRPLFARPAARRLVAASLLARAPVAAIDLPLILAAREASGSFAVAGLALGVRAAAVALTAPVRGRLLDRHGTRRAVPRLVVGGAAATAALPVAAGLDAGWLVVLLAGLTGALAPALPAAMRVEWQRLLGGEGSLLERAYAFESSVQVGLYVVGPLAAGAGIAVAGASATLVAIAVLLLAAGLAFAAMAGSAARTREPSARGSARSAWPALGGWSPPWRWPTWRSARST
jgi:MFS family permease